MKAGYNIISNSYRDKCKYAYCVNLHVFNEVMSQAYYKKDNFYENSKSTIGRWQPKGTKEQLSK